MKFKYILIPVLAILALGGCRKLTPAEVAAREGRSATFRTTCISGYTFTYNRYAPADRPVQVLDKEGNGIPCE